MRVEQVMRTSLVALAPNSSVEEAVQLMARVDTGRVVVVKEGEVKGILSTRDLVSLYAQEGEDMLKMSISKVLKSSPTTIGPKEELETAVRKMMWGGFGGLPVVEEGKLVGLLTEREVIRVVRDSNTRGIVDSVMTRSLITADPSISTREAAAIMHLHRVRRIPLVKGDEVVGIITAADIVKGLRSGKTKASELSPKSLLWCTPTTFLKEVANTMIEKRVGSLMVGEGRGRASGIVTERDVLLGSLGALG